MRLGEPPELDTDLRAVVEAARGGHEPSELARARVRKGLDVKLAAGIVLAAGPASSAFAGALKVTAAVVALGTVVTAGAYVVPRYVTRRAPVHAPAAHVVARPAPVAEAQSPEAPPAAVAPPQTAVSRPRVRHRAASAVAAAPAPAVEPSGLKEETALLGAANAALGRGDVNRALSLLDEYDRRPGAGMLAEERTVTGILASCAAGRLDAARAEARHFQARWPRSPLAARVDGSCVGSGRPAR